MKNLIWVRQTGKSGSELAKLEGPFSSYVKAEEFLIRVGSGTIVIEPLQDAKLRVQSQARDSYDRTNTEKLLVNSLDALAVEPKKKVAAKKSSKQM